MKKLSAILMLALVLLSQSSSYAAGQVSSRQFTKTNSDAATPTRLSATRGTFATKVTIIGKKSARVANTGTIYLGPTSANDAQALEVTTGGVVTITPATGEFIDLYEWYLDVATANDGVVVIYTF